MSSGGPAKRARSLAVAVIASVGLPAGTAHASQLVTWDVPSKVVDVSKFAFNKPPDTADRPKALKVDVLLPDGYDGKRQFPVLWLLHGHGDSFDSWPNPKQGDLANTGKGLDAIVVMPEGAQGWYTNWWNAGARGSDGSAWEDYHLDELMPYVNARLKILPQRRYHAIAGLSMGGEGAMYYAEQLPGYFGSAASFSGAISIRRGEYVQGFETQGQHYADVYGDPAAYWAQGHDPTALAANLAHTRLFVRVGDGTPDPTDPKQLQNTFGQVAEADLHFHANDFVAAAQAAGANVAYQPTQGIHDWPYWRAALVAAVKWGFFAPVDETETRWTYTTVRDHGRAWDLRYVFAKPLDGVVTFSRDGDRLKATGSGTVTVTADGRPSFTAVLPFDRTLPAPTPKRRPKRHHHKRHPAKKHHSTRKHHRR